MMMMDATEASYLSVCDNIHVCELVARCNEAIGVSALRASIPTHASIPTASFSDGDGEGVEARAGA